MVALFISTISFQFQGVCVLSAAHCLEDFIEICWRKVSFYNAIWLSSYYLWLKKTQNTTSFIWRNSFTINLTHFQTSIFMIYICFKTYTLNNYVFTHNYDNFIILIVWEHALFQLWNINFFFKTYPRTLFMYFYILFVTLSLIYCVCACILRRFFSDRQSFSK